MHFYLVCFRYFRIMNFIKAWWITSAPSFLISKIKADVLNTYLKPVSVNLLYKVNRVGFLFCSAGLM